MSVKDLMKALNERKVNQLCQDLAQECCYRNHLRTGMRSPPGTELLRLESQRGMGDLDIHLGDAEGLCRLRNNYVSDEMFSGDASMT